MSSTEEVNHLQIPLQELSDATNAFSEQNLIAKGGFGKVYRGVSVKHGNMAIKMLDPRRGQGVHEFKTEIALLSVYKHENIVSLIGYCDENEQKILVYKYEGNGSLDKHLTNAARGLQYLHNDVGSQHRILHRDVKSSNILLDENWKAKISDFGLSRVGPANLQSTFLISNVCGTIGYIDPDYYNTGYLTQKSDVYSFGVVLFEVLCGRLTRVPEYKDKREFLVTLVKIHWGRNTLDEIIFSHLSHQINRVSFVTFTSIAYQCLMSPNERPTMKKVVEQLQKALENQLKFMEAPPSGLYDEPLAAHLRRQSRAKIFSSQSGPASTSQLWKYDVFISFRGRDTHKTFVDHLYSALATRGLTTYKEDEAIPSGESISSLLDKAIQESQIAIIVFSQSYAGSSWCLNELALIMKNRREREQTVIPIFCGVNPSEVRKQTGRFGEAFSRHELHNNVESWRKALVEAADLSGWNLGTNEQEPKFIKSICDDVSNKLLSLMTPSEASANTYLIGVETRMQELRSLLEVGSGGVHMVGICGMWGSGKSTLASSIYNEISHEFEGCCFVKNVRARSRVHGLKTLQEEILLNVLKLKVTLTDIDQGMHMMERELQQNSVLVVLDDVDHTDHLKMLAGSKNWFGDGSRIIFTTRNQDLVKAHYAITHNVRMLDHIEAIELFCRHAFGNSKPPTGFEKVSSYMVSKLSGHPLALIRLGSFLRGKGMSEWMSILHRLEAIPVAEILKMFKMRDDGIARHF
ncbi:putative protein kinase RLK-Pelle-CrRLK1L-1 family [Helianthus annuus]|nr:putative protein kinase RLK-Pelle-CrRLK1L-1 family [Helianthus annuus]